MDSMKSMDSLEAISMDAMESMDSLESMDSMESIDSLDSLESFDPWTTSFCHFVKGEPSPWPCQGTPHLKQARKFIPRPTADCLSQFV